MTECEQCSARCDLYLCSRCTADIRSMLGELVSLGDLPDGRRAPGWLEYCQDSALGQTRMGDGQRRSRSDEVPIRVNFKASELLDAVTSMLSSTIRDICETRGVEVPIAMNTPVSMAKWLAAHVGAIAMTEGAGDTYREVQNAVRSIERMVNRPVPMRQLGPCPTIIDDHDGMNGHGRRCGTPLFAAHDEKMVQCSECETTHAIDELIVKLMNDIGDWHFTIVELADTVLPKLGQPVKYKTLHHWARIGVLTSSGRNDEGKPTYLLADVQAIQERKLARKTG